MALALAQGSAAAEARTRVRAMVSAAHPLATQAGLAVLESGGNAVDAAVAVQAVLNVVEPQSSGIGGGCFLLFYDALTRRVIALDGREEAPAGVRPDMFLDASGKPVPFYPDRITGGRGVGVPGSLAALHKAWRQYGSGSIPWAKLWERAIELARDGFPISPVLAEEIEQERERLALFPASRAIFLRADGTSKQEGEILVQKNLAETFRRIARQGPAVFYRGIIARNIVQTVRESPLHPGVLVLADLASYRACLRTPVSGSYRGYQIYGMPPPSSGGIAALEALNLLEEYPLEDLIREGETFVRIFSQAQRIAFMDRKHCLADADFVDIPRSKLISKKWARSRMRLIRHSSSTREEIARRLGLAGNESTSHISIMDALGNALAMTTTIEHYFGSAMVVPGRGFVLNNELTDFDAEPHRAFGRRRVPSLNRVESERKPRRTAVDIPASLGGKRPLSSMSPTLVFKDGKPYASLGSPGGTQIIGVVLNVLVNLIDFHMSAEEAVHAPRLIHRGQGIEVEEEFFRNNPWMATWQSKGILVEVREPFGDLQLVLVENPEEGWLSGASDPRGEGTTQGI
jgi:gamma-glutamyltranspeptidase/glutathione hydrolase